MSVQLVFVRKRCIADIAPIGAFRWSEEKGAEEEEGAKVEVEEEKKEEEILIKFRKNENIRAFLAVSIF